MADAVDSKSTTSNGVGVQVPSSVLEFIDNFWQRILFGTNRLTSISIIIVICLIFSAQPLARLTLDPLPAMVWSKPKKQGKSHRDVVPSSVLNI